MQLAALDGALALVVSWIVVGAPGVISPSSSSLAVPGCPPTPLAIMKGILTALSAPRS